MAPQLALLLCILFILYLFLKDYKRLSNISYANWLPLIWIIICGSRPVSLWLNMGVSIDSVDDYLEGSPIDRAVFLIIIVISLIILFNRNIYWSQLLQKNKWIFLLFLYGGISIIWSDFPMVSFKRWAKGTGNILMVLIILTDDKPVEAVKMVIKRSAYVLIPLSVLVIKYYPDLGRTYNPWTWEVAYTGVTTNKNSLGYVCLVSGFFFVGELIATWQKRSKSIDKRGIFITLLFLLMISWLFKVANSETSLIALIIGTCIFAGLNLGFMKRNIRRIELYVFIILLCILPVLLLGYSFFFSSVVGATGHSETFLGRTQLWNELLHVNINEFIGTGFESFWLGGRAARLWEKYWWHPTQAHNGYLETYLNLGYIGVVLLLGVIYSSYRNICKVMAFDFDYGRFRMGFLIIVVVYNITEAAFKGIHLMWFIFFLISIEYSKTFSTTTYKNS